MKKLKILDISDICTGCGACVNVCPKHSLRLEPDKEGFYMPSYLEGCVECGMCEKVCHVINADNKRDISDRDVFVYKSSDDTVREKSSSGGAFSLFADHVIKKGGVVFATLYNHETKRVEVSNTDVFPVQSFRKSKYVESFIGDTCSKIRKELNNGRTVLFCGTPCQVGGLKRYLETLKTDTSNLLTIDFICHGVPSMKCLNAFLTFDGRDVVNVDFRYKDFSDDNLGWHDMVYCEWLSSGAFEVLKSDKLRYYYYYWPFLENIMLRKSCYTCNEINHSSADITIADFWSIHKEKTIVDDNKGVSIVKIHTQKALIMWELLKRNGNHRAIAFDIVKSQFSSNKTGQRYKRDVFFEEVSKRGYINTVRRRYFLVYIKNLLLQYGSRIKRIIIK